MPRFLVQQILGAIAIVTMLAQAGSPQEPVKDAPPPNLERLFTWRPIGPANMGGRMTALAVAESDPSCYYAATASGGLLKTVNNGSTFDHQFDRQATVSIGAVAVAPSNKSIVWVGTGEANPRNSVSYGDGVYKSTDGGKSWKNMGLGKSYQIGKIVIHPKNPDIVYVGVLGRLYGPSEERGLYKTSDGGKTWQRIWFKDDKTGVLEVVMHPTDPNTLILAAWERQRDEFDSFVGDGKPAPATDEYAPIKTHGPGGGLFKTTDGGLTWHKLTDGLPKNANTGRIGLDWHVKDPNLVFAIIDTDKAGAGLPPPKAYIGIAVENSPAGLIISTVQDKGPAAKKLAKGDLVVAFNDKDLKKVGDFAAALQPRSPGDKVTLAYQRGDTKETVEITLAELPTGAGGKGGKGGAGFKGGGKGGGFANRPTLGVSVDASDDGLVITDVVEKGSGEKAGLKVGDVLTALNETKLTDQPTLIKLLAEKQVGDKVKIAYSRGKEKKEVEVTLLAPPVSARPYAGQLGGQRQNIQDQQGPDGDNTGGIYKSTDAGETWMRVNSLNERPFYFSVVRVDPNDEKTIYSLGITLYRSTDGGKTFSNDSINKGVHSDLHEMWINPKDSRHLLIGTDGGMYVSYDKGTNWEHLDHLALGQFYHVAVDTRRPYHVYGGLQDNGSWGGPSQTLRPSGPTNADYQYIQGGDGFVCRVDQNNPDIVYSESQNGNMFRRNLRTGEGKAIRPKTQAGATKFRFNWNTPFILSNHNSHIFYAGGNYVFRSVNQGDDLRVISPEITRTKHGTATALSESPKDPNVVWAGTDDGAVWITKDGGTTWDNLSNNFKAAGLPGPRWVSTIDASKAITGRCYVVFDAHRSNDDDPYVFVTEDFGKTWKSLRANLPSGSTRALREDITNPDLLYLGTEFAAFASINRGASWFKINGASLPTVAIHEFAQPTTAAEIVAATHGRSFWVLDVATLRQMKPTHFADKADLFAPTPVTRWQLDFTHEGMFRTGTRHFVGQNPSRQATFDYVLPKKAEQISLKVYDPLGALVRDLDVSNDKGAGVHRVPWDLATGAGKGGGKGFGGGKGGGGKGGFGGAGLTAKPGVYRVVLSADGAEHARLITVEPDPRTKIAGATENEAEEIRKLLKEQP
jgi:S1-C subfamily serine protease